MPDGVAVQDLPLVRIGPAGEGLCGPVLQLGEVLVACWQCSGGDQDGAQVDQGLAGGQLVQRGVGEDAPSRGELGEHGLRGGARQPPHDSVRPVGVGQRAVQGLRLGPDLARVVGEEFIELLVQVAPTAGPADQTAVAAAAGAGLEDAGVGDGAVPAYRCLTCARPRQRFPSAHTRKPRRQALQAQERMVRQGVLAGRQDQILLWEDLNRGSEQAEEVLLGA